MQKKICMLGASSVGKTSLVQRFVSSIYSEKYHMTIGVKIDKKMISVEGQDVTLLLWDLQGEDGDFKVRSSFLRGASGYFMVADLTRHDTLVTAFSIQQMVEREIGKLPFFVLLNKNDLTDQIEITETELSNMSEYNWQLIRTSAKTGENVNEAFRRLTEEILKKN